MKCNCKGCMFYCTTCIVRHRQYALLGEALPWLPTPWFSKAPMDQPPRLGKPLAALYVIQLAQPMIVNVTAALAYPRVPRSRNTSPFTKYRSVGVMGTLPCIYFFNAPLISCVPQGEGHKASHFEQPLVHLSSLLHSLLVAAGAGPKSQSFLVTGTALLLLITYCLQPLVHCGSQPLFINTLFNNMVPKCVQLAPRAAAGLA